LSASTLRWRAVAGPSFLGAVLAGGRSRRMGQDKATLVVHGEALAVRAARILHEAGADDVVAIGGDPVALGPGGLGLAVVADRHPGEGPLGAILTGLAALPDVTDLLVVVACDLWRLEPEAITAVVDAVVAAPPATVAALPRSPGGNGWEPLLGAYRRSAADPLEHAFRSGERAVHRALAGLEVAEVVLVEPAWLANANRPGDLPSQE
jgi:molybdopterin-guanine dinucleotide biosynthesis protein A